MRLVFILNIVGALPVSGEGRKPATFESPLPKGRGFLDTVLGRLRRQVMLCLAQRSHKWRRLRETRVQAL